jgi:tetratricopeptide (TPR) repeat protein
LRDLKLAQLVVNVFQSVKNAFGKPDLKPAGDRMQQMVSEQKIPYRSDIYKKGLIQFRDNMDGIMKLFSKKNIPLFVSYLISNEKDLKPFISLEPDSIKSPRFNTSFKLGLKSLSDGDLNKADSSFKRAVQLCNSSALCNYYLGRISYKMGNFTQAKEYFTKARDLDCLRFRAPGEFNEVLSQLSRKYPAIHLVNVEEAFEANATHQIIGDELIVDHVHPNLKGYAIISDMFYQAIKKYHVISDDSGNEMTFKQLMLKMPSDQLDSLAGIYRISNLKKRWPYNDPYAADAIRVASKEEQLAYAIVFENGKWGSIMTDLYQYYIGKHQLLKAKNILENLSLEYPLDGELYEEIAMLSGELKDYKDVVYNFKRSFNLAPSFDKARYLFVNYLQMDEPADAMTYIDYAISNNSSGFNLNPIKNNTTQIIKCEKAYLKDTANVSILLQIANLYSGMGSKNSASKYAEKALKADPQNKEASLLLAQISKTSKNEYN